MAKPEIGQVITTPKSGVVGTVKEIVPNASGSLRVRLETNSGERWTTIK